MTIERVEKSWFGLRTDKTEVVQPNPELDISLGSERYTHVERFKREWFITVIDPDTLDVSYKDNSSINQAGVLRKEEINRARIKDVNYPRRKPVIYRWRT